MEEKNGIDLENIMSEYIKTYGTDVTTDVTYTDDYISNLEHRIFYLLHS
jgi:hypothetical protein